MGTLAMGTDELANTENTLEAVATPEDSTTIGSTSINCKSMEIWCICVITFVFFDLTKPDCSGVPSLLNSF